MWQFLTHYKSKTLNKTINVTENIYNNSMAIIWLPNNVDKIKFEEKKEEKKKEWRKRDTISSKLFMVDPESILRKINWKGMEVKMNGKY